MQITYDLTECAVSGPLNPRLHSALGSVTQVKHKYNGLMLDVFREVFNWLPLAFVLNHQVLVLHGGLFSKDGVTLDDLRKVERNRCVAKYGGYLRGYSNDHVLYDPHGGRRLRKRRPVQQRWRHTRPPTQGGAQQVCSQIWYLKYRLVTDTHVST